MKRGSDIKRFAFACAIAISAFGCFYQPAVAAETLKDVSKEISDLRSVISSAEVHLIARDSGSRYNYGESDVVRSGCRYVITSAADLHSLIDVLANAQLVQVPASKEEYDARIVVRLYQGDSRIHAVVLSPDYHNANPHGEYRLAGNAFNRLIPIEAKNGTERDLRLWAAQHRSLAPKACGE